MIKNLSTITSLITLIFLALFQTDTIFASETVIQIPSINISASVLNAPLSAELQTWDVSHLYMNVGHLEYTPWFGSGNNIVIGGHSIGINGAPDIFYHLDAVQIGDDIFINDGGTSYRYQVSEIRVVDYTDTSIINPTPHETLTLFTCQTSSNNGSNFYTRRHVVIANRIE